jgi:hypothetical protein
MRYHFINVDAAKTPADLMDIPSYISGYVDGEGCFAVSFSPRMKMRTGWEVRPSFSVSQNADRGQVLSAIQTYFGCGGFRPDRSDNTIKFEVRDLASLLAKVIPHFERYPLLSGKRKDFETFAAICRLLERRTHLSRDGLREIARLAVTMNPSGKRRFQLAELIDYVRAEDIVSAASNSGESRSSDPHEWRNELGAVSDRYSAKLQYL